MDFCSFKFFLFTVSSYLVFHFYFSYNFQIFFSKYQILDYLYIWYINVFHHQLDIDPLNPADSENPVDTVYINSTAEDALREKYLRKLTNVILHHLPCFWRSTLSIFSGKFAKVHKITCASIHLFFVCQLWNVNR